MDFGLWREEGGKRVLVVGKLLFFGGIIATLYLFIHISYLVIMDNYGHARTGQMRRQNAPITKNRDLGHQIGGIGKQGPLRSKQRPQRMKKRKINYYAKQVIISEDAQSNGQFPVGTNLPGKLLNSIDTRTQHQVKAILAYDIKSKKGGGKWPAGTIFLGRASYPGHGDKVFIRFNQGILPNGQAFPIWAEALNTGDHSPGIEGTFHSNMGRRAATVLGLSLINGVSEAMVEKEALGQGFHVTPKTSVKNGLYNGLAKVTDRETNRQASKLHQAPEYITVEAGRDIIIAPTNNFKGQDD